MNVEREKLIVDLKRIAEDNYHLNSAEEAMSFARLMLQYIGDTDPILRDDLIYSTFYQWICEKQYFSNEELNEIVDTLIDEKHLFFHIGNEGDDTVFTRTFSALLMEVFLYWNRNNTYLSMDKFIKIKDSIIRYYNEEKDLRGYLDVKGWAHGAAHGADAMCELVHSKESDENTRLKVLDSLQRVLSNGKYILSNEEDERMTRVVFLIAVKALLPKESICQWIEGLEKGISSEYSREQYIARINTKNFIRCLYFSLMHQQDTKDITDLLFETEEKLNKFIRIDKILVSS
ncbi:DUF2785 domain-containing protein [Bacillus sp. S10(2024)]|uniref:DUF2785 domain-containing protein n=1 Tax=Bacillus sp. S10(2024) TaxID=3162886 RepID=UPI003D21E84D